VVLVSAVAVGTVGVPVNAGDAKGAASVIPYPATVVGLEVMLENAGAIVTALPTEVTLPFASTVKGRTSVATLL
jgi:hypothetical protein